jgi:Na+/H+-dicarboxylate symporter
VKRFLSLPNLIMAALVLGVGFGAAADATHLFDKLPSLQALFATVGGIFKNLIFMIIVPLVVFSLIGGMMGSATSGSWAGLPGRRSPSTWDGGDRVHHRRGARERGQARDCVPAETRDRIAKQYQGSEENGQRRGHGQAGPLGVLQDLVPTNVFSAASTRTTARCSADLLSIFFGLPRPRSRRGGARGSRRWWPRSRTSCSA